jgi:hypothetical protein
MIHLARRDDAQRGEPLARLPVRRGEPWRVQEQPIASTQALQESTLAVIGLAAAVVRNPTVVQYARYFTHL